MKILNRDSLLLTVENFEVAQRGGVEWTSEAPELIDWVSGRLGQRGGYAGSFAMTESDWERPFRLYTGEKLTTGAGRSHVIAQETTRMLRVLESRTGESIESLRESEARLGERIFLGEGKGEVERTGMFCCGPCSVAFWRALIKRAYPGFSEVLPLAPTTLRNHRDNRVGWRRFPLYYTLSFLAEVEAFDLGDVVGERQGLLRRLALLQKKQDDISIRRAEILERILRN